MKIPLTKPYWGKAEQKAAARAIGEYAGSGDGKYTRKLIEAFKKMTGAAYVLPITSCTHGLELAMRAMNLKEGDEVIVPSFTMTSTANAVVLTGATPVFAEVDPVYFCLDPEDVERKITARTRGIAVIHYAGMAADMERLQKIARKHKLFIIEDAAHAVGAYWNGKMLGTIGDIGVYSFHGTKNISCGEGGVVLTNRKDLVDKMEIYRANGTNRKAYLDGLVDRYSWVGHGTSYFLADILAAILLAQVKIVGKINKKRAVIAAAYSKALKKYSTLLVLPRVSPGTRPNWHIYGIKFHKVEHRNVFLQEMRKKGIDVAYHYVPLHSSTYGKKLHGDRGQLPVTENVFSTLVRLPIYPALTKKNQSYIINSAHKILSKM